jgi:acetolactate synthase-1/2/3 large subunit
MLIRPDKMGEMVRHLLRVAMSGRRGPVHLSIPADLAKKPIPMENIAGLLPQHVTMSVDRESIRKASHWLLRAKNPVILVGNGVNLSHAHEELLKLSERLKVPVATTVKAKAAFPEDHLLSLGAFGFAGSPRADAYLLSGEVDVLLAIGTSLDEDATAGWDARLKPREALLHIDIDPIEMGKNYAVTVPMVGDAKNTLSELLYQIERDGGWLEERPRSLAHLMAFREKYPWCHDAEKMDSLSVPIKPQRLMKDLSNALPQDALIFTDIGNHMAWAFHYLQLAKPNSFHHCLGFASMGYGTAAVIGAKLGNPSRPVVAIVGDASFAMNGMELHTAVEYNLSIVWIVHNNGGHGMVYHGEKVQFGNRFHYSMFREPMDFCQLAKAMGAIAYRVTRPGELTVVMKEALTQKRPVLIDAIVDAEEAPPVGSRISALEKFFEHSTES